MRTTLFLGVAIGALLVVGCTSTQRVNVSRSGPMTAHVEEKAPFDATYTVQVRRDGSDDYDAVKETRVHVRPGTPLGFQRHANGVQAFAGDVFFTVPAATDAELKWYAKKKRPSDFANGADGVVSALGFVAAGVGAAVVEGAVDEAIEHASRVHKGHHH